MAADGAERLDCVSFSRVFGRAEIFYNSVTNAHAKCGAKATAVQTLRAI